MGTRTQDLTKAAQSIAEELRSRGGSLKHIYSAGIMALSDMTPLEREYYMAKASGMSEDELQKIHKKLQGDDENKGHPHKTRPAKAG